MSAGPGADTDNASDVYRYDAEKETMVRVSTAVSGGGGNADVDATLHNRGRDASVPRSNRRSITAMTADGSTVVFETSEALSTEDDNGLTDVYAWQDGNVSLISDGVGGGETPWITPSGRDIFFVTDAS